MHLLSEAEDVLSAVTVPGHLPAGDGCLGENVACRQQEPSVGIGDPVALECPGFANSIIQSK